MAVALQHLGCDRGGAEAELLEDGSFVRGVEMAEGADGAGELADAEILGSGVEPAEVPAHFGVPEQQFEAESSGFGVYSMGAPDGGGVLKLNCALA